MNTSEEIAQAGTISAMVTQMLAPAILTQCRRLVMRVDTVEEAKSLHSDLDVVDGCSLIVATRHLFCDQCGEDDL